MTSASMSVSTQSAEFRAAGTDLSERRRSGLSQGPLIDIAAAPGTIGIDWGADGAARIGAFTTIAAIAADARINGAYPGLAAAASASARSRRCRPRRRSPMRSATRPASGRPKFRSGPTV